MIEGVIHQSDKSILKNQKQQDYLTRKNAAKYIGIHPDTLVRWERKNAIKSFRHPVNSYRLYKIQDLEKLLWKINCPQTH